MALVPFPASTAVVARAAAVALIRGALGLATNAERIATDAEENATDAERIAADAERIAADAERIATDAERNATALRLGEVASALVGRYDNCTGARSRMTPEAVLDEAVLRVAGWINDTPAANVQSLSVGRAVSFKFDATMRNALRSSGAMDLLSGWRQHDAGIVEAVD